jgi:hypothetical protein
VLLEFSSRRHADWAIERSRCSSPVRAGSVNRDRAEPCGRQDAWIATVIGLVRSGGVGDRLAFCPRGEPGGV